MYDIEHLESQWYQYRRKRLLVPFVGVLVVLAGAAAYYFFGVSQTPAPLDPAPKSVVSKASKPEQPAPQPSVRPAVAAPEASLSPEVPSMKVAPKKKTGWTMTFEDEEPSEPQTKETTSAKHIDIQVTSKKSHNTVQDIEHRFRSEKDKDDALFLARYYYDKKEYAIALKWALETNKLDSDIEESWLIFSKSKAKLGQRVEAIRLLQAYCDRSASAKAKKLLGAIRMGKSF